jgi:hypothetical protein
MARKLALPGAAMPIKWVLNCAGLLVLGNYTSKLTVITGDNRRRMTTSDRHFRSEIAEMCKDI